MARLALTLFALLAMGKLAWGQAVCAQAPIAEAELANHGFFLAYEGAAADNDPVRLYMHPDGAFMFVYLPQQGHGAVMCLMERGPLLRPAVRIEPGRPS